MATSIIDEIPDLVRLRSRASRGLAAFLWLHIPFVSALAAQNHTNWNLQVGIATALAAAGSIAAWLRPAALATRLVLAAALTAMPILFVYNGTGTWQVDYHMYFFAVFAMLAAFCDWRPIVLAATLTGVHHLTFNALDPSAGFPNASGTSLVLVYMAIVAAECGVLLWMTHQIRSLFRDSSESRSLAEARYASAANAAATLADNAALATEVAERRRVEQRLLHVAFHDDLTGLRSRSFFADALEGCLERSKHHTDYRFALLFIDLDRFKLVNDSLGHRIGDQLLIAIADRLRTVLRSGDTLARMGGDEFTLLLDSIDDVGNAVSVAERIADLLALPFTLSEHELFGSASIGITDSARGYDRPEDIVRDADCAMYEAKRRNSGRGGYAIYEPAMDAKASISLALQNDLRQAVEREEFFLHYQPIVRLGTASIVGFEALVRWQHPVRGLIAPSEFIAIAEETGLILAIGSWVLDRACRQMHEWETIYGDRLNCMSVNVSGRQLEHPSFARDVDSIIAASGIDPHHLQLEMTESVLLANVVDIGAILVGLRANGVRIAFDDFGTGFSSLSHLQRYRVDTLKIDQSFVRGIADDPANVEIIKAIVALAQTLQVGVDAEGVETAQQLNAVAGLGCTSAQGYYFSEAVPAEDVPALLRADARKTTAVSSGGRLHYPAGPNRPASSKFLLHMNHP